MTAPLFVRALEDQSFSWQLHDAMRFPCKSPIRLLAAAVIARWVQDGRPGRIGREWADIADVPHDWLEVHQ